MGFFDTLGRKNNNSNDDIEILDDNISYSKILSNEIIEEIKRINKIDYISDKLIKKLEKYPELIEILLKGNISEEMISFLNLYDELIYFPDNVEDLKYIKYFELNDKQKKMVSLLKNRIYSFDNNDYLSCYFNLGDDFKVVDYSNDIDSYFSDIKIHLGNELLTEISIYSRYIMSLPKSKYEITSHNYIDYIVGNVELDENVIIQMSYDTFCYLDESIVDKISKCKIVFLNDNLEHDFSYDIFDQNEINYSLVKFNHLIYVIENSSIDSELKERIVYKLKNIYTNNDWYIDLDISDILYPYLDKFNKKEIEELTKEFELNIKEYLNKEIEKPEFNAEYYIEENFPNFELASVSDIIYSINHLSDDEKIKLLKEPKILNKLGISDDLNEDQLKKIINLLSKRLSLTTADFVRSFDFDIDAFLSDPNNDYMTTFKINPIIKSFGVFDYIHAEDNISIADIVGHDGIINCDYYKGDNILYTFENFFEKNGDGYHTRALGLLEYKSGEELLKELNRRNNDTRDMKVCKIEDGKYIMDGNGLHRYSVLRFHYLMDRAKKEKSEEELREIYRIPVEVTSKTNYKKTYCNYLLQRANPDISYISFDYREDKITIDYKSDKEREIINERELMDLTVEAVNNLELSTLIEIQNFYNRIDSFHSFVDMYVPNLVEKFNEISNEKDIEEVFKIW